MKTKREVMAHGKKMLKLMRNQEDWDIVATENLGWFVRLIHKRWRGLTVSPGYNNEPRYHAMLSSSGHWGACDSAWYDNKNFSHPQKAVDHRIELASAYVRQLREMLNATRR